MIVNTQRINPMPVVIGAAEYPVGILDELASKVDVTKVDALSLAQKAGNVKAVNVALIGVMAKNTEVPYEVWIDVLKKTVPAKFLDLNLAAFNYGYEYQA